MPIGISAREFAKLDGCSHTRVNKAIRTGHLKTFKDGTLDAKLVRSGWRKENRRALSADRKEIHSANVSGNASQNASTVSTGNVSTPQAGGNGTGRGPAAGDVDRVALEASCAAESAAVYVAELLLPISALATADVRRIAETVSAKLRAGAIACLEEGDVPPPAGAASWGAWDHFTRPVLTEAEWAELQVEFRGASNRGGDS